MRGPSHPQIDLERLDVTAARALGGRAHKEIDSETAHDATARENGSDAARRLLYDATIAAGCGEAAALIHLPRAAAQDLVVRREKHHFALRVDPQLSRRRDARRLEELLDDAALRSELREIAVRGLLGHRGDDSSQIGNVEASSGRLSSAKSALPSPEKLSSNLNIARRSAGFRRRNASSPSKSSASERRSSNPSGKSTPASRKMRRLPDFVPRCGDRRIDTVQGDSEQDGELSLERRGVEDRQVGAARVGDPVADSLDQARPLQNLLGQRTRRGVVSAQETEPRARVAGGDSGEQLEVAFEDEGMHGLRRHVDHAGLRIAESNQEKQQPLLVVARGLELRELMLGRESATERRRRCRAPPRWPKGRSRAS